MADLMTPIPFGELMRWILSERRHDGAVFGVEKAYTAQPGRTLPLFGEQVETPVGPAAGPHTQLAQNIVAAYYAGARFFELKTVQTMDGEALRACVQKPCILAEDEGYNCEWSTELTVEQAMEEYIKAWFLCKLLAREYRLGDKDGFVFNMSVGYDYAGITSKKIDDFIEGMKNASNTPVFQACKQWALDNLRLFERVNARYIEEISPHVCTSITLSTLHGCPPGEIERIAAYLIENKKLHTFVKCNPTILGYESARSILDSMGYDYIAFDEHHFLEDLQFKDAVPMCKRLKALAEKAQVEFGLKLSNTFPVDVRQNELPSEEMYMSGRALYPLTIEMAARFTKVFDGRMRLSFSGGADAFNVRKLFEAGIWPITVATTALKPGGYERFFQLASTLASLTYAPFGGVKVTRVENLAHIATSDAHHKKPLKPVRGAKIDTPLPLSSCFTAACKSGCPIGQDIPEYIRLVGEGKHAKAMEVITRKNPLPFITGRICSHRCMDSCMRAFYEEPVRIRSAKLEAARGGFEAFLGEFDTPVMKANKRAAIVGGGPSGLAAAYFLGRAGMPVTLYEQKQTLGGIVRHVIPRFRISDHAIDKDIELVEKMGVRFKLGQKAPGIEALKEKGYDYVLLATGAWAHGKLPLTGGEAMNVLDFLEAFNRGELEGFGKQICIVGGGNTAMDAARAAKRIPGVEKVRIVYRRTKRYMPADEEELQLALAENVEFCELLAPVSLENGMLLCKRMALGAPDASGRRAPVETAQTEQIPCDTLIAAVGEHVDTAFYERMGIACDARGKAALNPHTLETSLPGVYVLGDANRGPATVVEGIADAQRVADAILGGCAKPAFEDIPACKSAADCRQTAGVLNSYENASREVARCLQCNTSCEVCAQVCPNRANVALHVPGYAMRQIVHIERMCNECGNCAIFCPYADAPYKKKLTLFHTQSEFDNSENPGFLAHGGGKYSVRIAGALREVNLQDVDTGLEKDVEAILFAIDGPYSYLL